MILVPNSRKRSVHPGYHNARAMLVFKAKSMLPNMTKEPTHACNNQCDLQVRVLLQQQLHRMYLHRLGNIIRRRRSKYATDLFNDRV